MSCKDALINIEAYLDGELTLSDRRDFEEHLLECDDCKLMLESVKLLNKSIRKVGYVNPPASLKRSIKTGLRDITGEEGKSYGWLQLIGFGGSTAALASVAVWVVMSFMFGLPAQTQLSNELISAHVRSLMVDHATDVTSLDSHTVKPWFNGKLDFSPAVKNLDDDGFVLVGGRLDYLQQQPVAALVYRRRSHIINLFIYRANETLQVSTIKESQQQGYTMFSWSKQGLEYRVISDLNEKELKQFTQLLDGQAIGQIRP